MGGPHIYPRLHDSHEHKPSNDLLYLFFNNQYSNPCRTEEWLPGDAIPAQDELYLWSSSMLRTSPLCFHIPCCGSLMNVYYMNLMSPVSSPHHTGQVMKEMIINICLLVNNLRTCFRGSEMMCVLMKRMQMTFYCLLCSIKVAQPLQMLFLEDILDTYKPFRSS